MALFKKKEAKEDQATPAAVEQVPTETTNKVDDDEEDVPEGLRPVATTATEDIVYPTGLKLALLLSSVFMSMFLVSLDRLIISTAIPQITDDFHSVTDIGWYGSAYLLTNCSFQLLYGKIYTFFSIKAVFLSAVFLFEVGSAICGAAPSSTSFIIGRAIAGLGSSGIMSGAITIIVYAVPLHKRPLYQGLFGAVFGLSSVIGPLLGGAFTTKVTWRWCFYINLPFGAIAMVFIFLLLNIPERETTKLPLLKKIMQLDLYGTAAILPGCVCLLLALQWGGLTYEWSDGRIIALLTLGAVLLIGFVLIQVWKADTATVPPRIFMQRSIAAGSFAAMCVGSQMMIFVYYLPIWFQAIRGIDAVDSGIRLLPMVLPMVASSICTGALVSKVGYYTPFMIVGSCIIAVGAGLLTTLEVDTSDARTTGYQILYGWGLGQTFQAPNLAAQTVLARHDVPVGSSLMFFTQLLGGAIFISVGQNVLNNQLLNRLSDLPGFNPGLLRSAGATSLISQLPDSIKPAVLSAYNDSLRVVFQVGLVMSCVGILGALAMEWRSVKKNLPKKGADAEPATVEEGKAEKDSDSDKGPEAAEAATTTLDLEKETGRSTASTEATKAVMADADAEPESTGHVDEKKETSTTA